MVTLQRQKGKRMIPLLVWGAGGHALTIADIAQTSGKYEIIAYIDNVNEDRAGQQYRGKLILASLNEAHKLRLTHGSYWVVAIGDCASRLDIARRLENQGARFATLIHPKAYVAPDALIGYGTTVNVGAVVLSDTQVGRHAILGACCSIGHSCVIESGAHIAPGVRLASNIHVKRGAGVGIGATIINDVTIGAFSAIGAGAVVTRDVPEGVVACGMPARAIRRIEQLETQQYV